MDLRPGVAHLGVLEVDLVHPHELVVDHGGLGTDAEESSADHEGVPCRTLDEVRTGRALVVARVHGIHHAVARIVAAGNPEAGDNSLVVDHRDSDQCMDRHDSDHVDCWTAMDCRNDRGTTNVLGDFSIESDHAFGYDREAMATRIDSVHADDVHVSVSAHAQEGMVLDRHPLERATTFPFSLVGVNAPGKE